MRWRKGTFKESEVWIGVDAAGDPVVERGRTPIKYKPSGKAKVYRAGASRVAVDPDAPAEEFDDDAAPSFGSAGTRTAAQAARAKAATQARLEDLDDSVIRAFTDGSCRGNPGPAGAGALVVLPDGRRGEASASLGRATNNVGELTAVGLALDLLDEAGVDRESAVALFTDSKYAMGVLTKGWKAKANRELILSLRDRIGQWPNLRLGWVPGHVGVTENERADVLANAGVDGVTRSTWTDG